MSDTWRVIIGRDATKTLRRLPRDLRERISRAIDGLEQNPRPRGYRKLEGYGELYRVRVGDWRIIYTIQDAELVVLVIEIAPRGGA